jgi:nucleoside-diphosphate-sugar epimerase
VFGRAFPSITPPRHEAPRAGDIVHSLGDPSAAVQTLGFRAEVSVEEGLLELAAVR